MTSISESSVKPNHQLLLDSFEIAAAAGDEDAARQALRRYLFAAQGLSCEGSLADAIASMAQNPMHHNVPAAVVLRALSVPGVVRTHASNNMARFVVQLIEGAMPDVSSLAKIGPKMQNFQKFEALEHVHRQGLDRLEPLRIPYSSVIRCWLPRPRSWGVCGIRWSSSTVGPTTLARSPKPSTP